MGIDIQPEDSMVFGRLSSTGRITHGLRRLITQQWGTCSVCGHVISRGRPAFAGYDTAATPLYVCASCAGQLVELATPIYWDGTLNLAVDDQQKLWRYMDFAKFTAMLGQRGVYFPRADKLEDPFEGATGLAQREEDWDRYYLDFFRSVVATAPPGYAPPDLSPDEIEAKASRLLAQMKVAGSSARSTLVSCWHANVVESEALWRLYCPPPVVGVAIRTTVAALWDATADDVSAVVGRVHYVDFRQSYAHNDQKIFCKRLSLSHEKEVRAALRNDDHELSWGRLVPCDLEALIDQVIISPFAPSWSRGVVTDVIDKFGFHFDVRTSELLDEPFF